MKHVILDLGNVVALFDHRVACRQLASLSPVGTTEDEVFRAVFGTSLEADLDCGNLSSQAFLDRLRALLRSSAADAALAEAWCDIFRPNDPVIALLPRLRKAAASLLLASNTNALHFEWIAQQMPEPLAVFDSVILSYQIGLRKPAPAFFQRCIEIAGAAPRDCVFIDDRPVLVEGARTMGMAGVVYHPGLDLVETLGALGVRLD